jgi:hypothetical protein
MNADSGSALGAEPTEGPQLTPAASEKLDQNVEYVRTQILREISRQSSYPGYRARASDVESAVNRISSFDSASRIVSRTTVLAIILGIMSLAFELLSQLGRNNSSLWLGSGVALLVGITTGTTVVLIIQEIRRRRRVSSAPVEEFLYACARLEDSMRKHARELLGSLAEDAALGRVISAVELLQLWTPEDSQAFRRVLAIRNSIVHEDSHDISSERIASAFSQMARLSSLLDSNVSSGRTKRRIKDFATSRAALAFEERVTNALRRAGVGVSSAQGDVGYDLLAGRSESLKRIVIKYRASGVLTVNDISDAVDQPQANVDTVIVTNATVSPYVYEYLDLTYDNSDEKQIKLVRWENGEDTEALVHAITAERADV